jgi:hypothetical protein
MIEAVFIFLFLLLAGKLPTPGIAVSQVQFLCVNRRSGTGLSTKKWRHTIPLSHKEIGGGDRSRISVRRLICK